MSVSEMTHDDIADWCATRLKGLGYRFAFSNMTSAVHGEQPDVLGLTSYGNSIVVEVKVSRSDFLADKKKPWRANPNMGMGQERVYLAPEGLLKLSDIPYGWQLWEIYGKNKPRLRVVKGQAKENKKNSWGGVCKSVVNRNIDKEELQYFSKISNTYQAELMWVLKVLGRAQDAGLVVNHYANNYQEKK